MAYLLCIKLEDRHFLAYGVYPVVKVFLYGAVGFVPQRPGRQRDELL